LFWVRDGLIFDQPSAMLALLFGIHLFFHPLHISVTEIEYNGKVKSLQIISRIFIDDLETAIRAGKGLPNLDLLNPGNGLKTESLVADYLKTHLKIKLDGKDMQMKFLGYEEESFAFVCYIEIENISSFKELEVENTIITEAYDDQSNLVHVTYNGPVRSARLVKGKPIGTFTFEGK